jgi:hypothetical protein
VREGGGGDSAHACDAGGHGLAGFNEGHATELSDSGSGGGGGDDGDDDNDDDDDHHHDDDDDHHHDDDDDHHHHHHDDDGCAGLADANVSVRCGKRECRKAEAGPSVAKCHAPFPGYVCLRGRVVAPLRASACAVRSVELCECASVCLCDG